MAPAKSDRADARRRYRAYQLDQDAEGDEATDEEASEVEAKPKRARAADEPQIRPGQRVGMAQALRLAVRPVHYVEDIKFLPKLVTTPAVWGPTLLSVGTLIFGFTRNDYNDGSIQLILGLLLGGGTLGTPALLQPLAAGYFAPRASWLAGAISGIVSSICFIVIVAYWFGPTPHLANLPDGHLIVDATDIGTIFVPAFLGGVTMGALLAAASAWYKRFLNMLAGNTRQPSGKPQRGGGRR